MEEKKRTDVVIIGSGPGGYVAAIRAAQRGAKVAIVEKNLIGGVCLNRGCIPTKSFARTAELYREIRDAHTIGIHVGDHRLDMARTVASKNETVAKLRSGVQSLLKSNGVEIIQGIGKVLDRGIVEVTNTDHKTRIEGRSIIVATGSEPASLPGLTPDGTHIITSTEALDLEQIPNSLVVIGGGYIGLEFASVFAAFGTKVTIIEMMPQVLTGQDKEVSKRMLGYLKARGIEVHLETRFEEIQSVSSDKLEIIASGKNEQVKVVAEKALVAVGRKLNSTGIFADGLAIAKNKDAIVVNEKLETTGSGIYAIGDVTGKVLLAHLASAQGLIAAANATGGRKTIDYKVVPACVFCSPEVASVGLTEDQARDRDINVAIGKFPFSASGRALIMGQTDGFVKLVLDADTHELLGGHVIGPDASHLIAEIALAIGTECTVEEIAHTIHTHPTLSEAWMEAADDALGFPVHQVPKRTVR